tara:strand:+ start:14728 stop:15783 length:1056 start_codon:yes stop_codon:yes gene_type:complete
MKTTTTTIIVLIIAGCTFAMIDQQKLAEQDSHAKLSSTIAKARSGVDAGGMIRASGRIEGRTERVEIRARIDEQIESVRVHEGQWVNKGDLLIELDSEQLLQHRQLAAAQLRSAKARLERVQNGFRDSEIEATRSQHQALAAELEGAKKNLDRVRRLAAENAESKKTVDDHLTRVMALEGQVAAAKSNLDTYQAPPRTDELNAAIADVAAADSQLAIAETNLRRTKIVAPIDGKVLAIEGEAGELTGPESVMPLVTLVDTSQLRVMAEVDEYDALRIEIGQKASITADSIEGVLAEGQIVEMDPLMNPKESFGQWAGERKDAYSRPVWIRLDDVQDLPVGLPVDVYIHDDL